MPSTSEPADLSAALEHLRPELPGLTGAARGEELPAAVREAVERLGSARDPQAQASAALGVTDALAHYPNARDRVTALAAELSGLRAGVGPVLREMLKDDARADFFATSIVRGVMVGAEAAPTGPVRGMTTGRFGVGGAKTVKLRNFWVNPGKVVEFLAHSAIVAVHGSAHPEAITIGLGVILLANCARESVTIHIPEQDATVFWGLTQAHKKSGAATAAPEPDVVACTNDARQEAKLGSLAPESVARSLEYLEGISCVGRVPRVPTHWRVTETYQVHG